MTVEELRINNIVLARGAQSEVKSIDENHVGYSKSKKGKWIKRETLTEERVPIKLIQPIPLTEEWLVKFGFEKGSYKGCDETHYVNNEHTIRVIISGIGYWDVYTDYNPFLEENNGLNAITDNRGLRHVHQLQNLYFALTQKELTIKN